jgi:hypothetical protein
MGYSARADPLIQVWEYLMYVAMLDNYSNMMALAIHLVEASCTIE